MFGFLSKKKTERESRKAVRSASAALIDVMSATAKLEKAGLIAVNWNSPYMYIGHEAYDAFMCNDKGEFDSEKAKDFCHKMRIYINFQRSGNGVKELFDDNFRIRTEIGGELDNVILRGWCTKNEVRLEIV